MTKRRISPAGAAVTLAAVGVVIAGLVVIGTPSHARERRLDEMRVDDLSTLSQALDLYWSKHAALPDSLDSLVTAHQLDRIPKDPETNARYTYVASGVGSYRLCATFTQASDTAEAPQRSRIIFNARSWRHGVGESCFDLTAPPPNTK